MTYYQQNYFSMEKKKKKKGTKVIHTSFSYLQSSSIPVNQRALSGCSFESEPKTSTQHLQARASSRDVIYVQWQLFSTL